jgi:antitoxin VapB
MGMNIKDPDVHAMTKELALLTGVSLTAAVKMAVEQALIQARAQHQRPKFRSMEQNLTEISLRCAALPDCDRRSMDEILGYDEFGLPS